MKMSSHGSHADSELPDIDDHIVVSECGYEIDDGKVVRVPPALPPHAERHSKLSALLEAHVAEDFNAASDMLTRTSLIDDIAPDASVFPRAKNPATGGRQLEHLAFEIVNTQTLLDSGRKAAKLCGRGVRRVFAIDVQRERAFEWSTELGTWSPLDATSFIEDLTLAVPLPVAALLRVVRADDAVAAALLAKGNRVLVAAVSDSHAKGHAEGRAEGLAEGLAEALADLADAIVRVLARRNLMPTPAELERIRGEGDRAVLKQWLEQAVTCADVDEMFAAGV